MTPALAQRNNSFNFLRLVFASAVILSHSVEWKYGNKLHEPLMMLFGTVSFSDIAVDGFFLLSGYLIVQSWTQAPALREYFIKRILRIYPGFIVANLIAVFIIVPLITDSHFYFAHFVTWKFLRSLALLRLPEVPNMFWRESYPYVNAPVWTISHEFRCYSLVALCGLTGILKKPCLWFGLTLLAVAVLVIGLILPNGVIEDQAAFWGSDWLIGAVPDFARLFSFFGIGGCFFLFRDRVIWNGKWALIGFPLLLLALFNDITANLALLTIGGYVLFYFAFARFPQLHRFNPDSDISYGVYLYGWPVQRLFMFYCPRLSPVPLFFLTLLGSAVCGLWSWHFIEQPFLRLRPRSVTLGV